MKLDVFMHSWIIEDGNYSNFSEGETRQFALEFWTAEGLKRSTGLQKSMIASSGYTYDVVAEVVFASAEVLVIDFGLLAYSETSSDLIASFGVGDFVEGNLALAVDPFFYFETLSKLPDVPALIYEWHIDWVEQETTPLVLGEICGRQGYVSDPSRIRFERVESTSDVIPVPNGICPSYVLHSTKLDRAPMRQFSRPHR